MNYYFNKYKPYLLIGGVILLISLVFISYILIESKEEPNHEVLITTKEVIEPFYVDIKGAVKKPGVYLFEDGNRIIDAIKSAGGLTGNANTSNINLSQRLTGEMVVYVYTNHEIRNGSKAISCSTICEHQVLNVDNCFGSSSSVSGKININTATVVELTTLPGIGEVRAQAIIEFRTVNGFFIEIEDLKKVSGIGEATFNNLKERITI